VATVTLMVPCPARAETRAVDENAVNALERMGKYLRDLKTFEIKAEVTDEDVLANGLKVQRTSSVSVLASRPNRLRAEVTSDRHQRLFLYDGKSFTLVAERLGYYATVPAPDTIGELIDRLEDRFAIRVPLVDLFRWGESGAEKLTAAIDVGPSVVDGVTCEQYTFRQKDIDWQVWIQKGPFPLPRKLVITTKTDPARPQHTAVYTWNLAPSFNEAAFSLEPTPGMHRVDFAGAVQQGRPRKQGARPGGEP
jgi:hypothetical protein